MQAPILIAGAPRSGTSMTAGLLAAHGVWCGKTLRPGPRNPKGYFENQALKNLMKQVLSENGWGTVPQIGSARMWPGTLVSVPAWKRRVEEVIASENPTEPWLVKESRVLLTWPLWREAWPDAFYVFPRRPLGDVARSMEAHEKVSRNGDRAFLLAWAEECWNRQFEIAATTDRHIFLDTHAVATGNTSEASRLLDAAGIAPCIDRIERWVDSSLWHAA